MIHFFRKIRRQLSDENKTLRYLKYAIGEIVLVVIGILIALQVNNWNEGRKVIQREKINLVSTYHDLKNDLAKIDGNYRRLSTQFTIALEVMSAMENSFDEVLDSSRVAARLGWDLSEMIPVERDRTTWDELKVRGAETHLLNDTLKSRIDQFYEVYDRQIDLFNQLPKKVRLDLRELTGTCHNAETVQSMHKNGFREYGASSQALRHCILSKDKAYELTGTIALSASVHMALYDELTKMAESLMADMEAQFEFL